MKCPACGHEMNGKAKCLRCGYTVKSVVPIDPEKVEQEGEPTPERREINPDDVHVSRAGRSVFDDIFGGGIFGNLFGGSIFGGLGGIFDGFFDSADNDAGYEYDPKYYDDFGNEIYVPDEFERESVEISDAEVLEEPKHEKHDDRKVSHDDRKVSHDDRKSPHAHNHVHPEENAKAPHRKKPLADKLHRKHNRRK